MPSLSEATLPPLADAAAAPARGRAEDASLHIPGRVPVPVRGAQDRNLDVLRATAVLLVLASHTIILARPVSSVPTLNHLLHAAGFGGVIIFFVHTSLVLMRSLARSSSRGLEGWPRARDFYIRRAFRIYPLAVVTVIAVIVFHLPRMPRDLVYHDWQSRTVLANLMLVQNAWGSGSVLGPLWSLPLEVQMYMVLPLVFIAVRSSGLGRLAVCAMAAILAAVAQWHFAHTSHELARLNVLQYAPCFVTGALAYRLCDLWQPRIRAAQWPVVLAGLITVAVVASAHSRAGMIWAWALAGAIGIAIPLTSEMRDSRLTRGARTVAKYSYGVYVSHIAVLDVVLQRMPHAPVGLRVAFGVIGIIGLPVLLYHALENPMIRIGAALAARLEHRPAYAGALSSTAPAP